jgi:hypothetical protein
MLKPTRSDMLHCPDHLEGIFEFEGKIYKVVELTPPVAAVLGVNDLGECGPCAGGRRTESRVCDVVIGCSNKDHPSVIMEVPDDVEAN